MALTGYRPFINRFSHTRVTWPLRVHKIDYSIAVRVLYLSIPLRINEQQKEQRTCVNGSDGYRLDLLHSLLFVITARSVTGPEVWPKEADSVYRCQKERKGSTRQPATRTPFPGAWKRSGTRWQMTRWRSFTRFSGGLTRQWSTLGAATIRQKGRRRVGGGERCWRKISCSKWTALRKKPEDERVWIWIWVRNRNNSSSRSAFRFLSGPGFDHSQVLFPFSSSQAPCLLCKKTKKKIKIFIFYSNFFVDN